MFVILYCFILCVYGYLSIYVHTFIILILTAMYFIAWNMPNGFIYVSMMHILVVSFIHFILFFVSTNSTLFYILYLFPWGSFIFFKN